MKTKQELRDYIKKLFLLQDREEFNKKNFIIQRKIEEYIIKNNVQNICIYESVNNEVDTGDIIKFCRERRDVKIYIPQMIGEIEMILIGAHYEIFEEEIDLFIIPGRGFTQDGERLGRGKGYYDRFLDTPLYKKSKKLGICYDFQILENIPIQKHDITMDFIISN